MLVYFANVSDYQKGVLPKYLRDRKDTAPKDAEGALADNEQAVCPPGHVTLPDTERKETLRMLRNSMYIDMILSDIVQIRFI